MNRDLLASLVEQGMSMRELALYFNKGQTTIRYWLKKFNLKTKNKSFTQGYNYPKRVDKNNQYCCSCNAKLTPENAYDRKNKNTYSSYCKSCYCNNTLNKRLFFKQKCVEYKGNQCQKCGYDKNLTALDFHHLNPKEKEFNPSKMMNKTWDTIRNELNKCVLLCSNCHREEHNIINKRKKLEKEFSANLVNNLSDVIFTGRNTGKNSCKQCDIVLTEENTGSGTHSKTCKSCDSKNFVERGIKGKEKSVEYMGGCCSVCGYDQCINSLEFHHVDPSKKSPTYSRRFCYWGFERQKKELENCIIVCSNCHREIHAKDLWST